MNYLARKLSGAVGLVETAVVRSLHLRHRYPPLFVVGVPRSGTTVVIQHIINRLRFGYFPNVARRHADAPITFSYVTAKRHHFEVSYTSDYGLIDGPMAPSDGWEVFHRWFPRYDYDQPVRTGRLHELRTIVALLERIFDAPIANKNNSNTVRIPYLDSLFPDAFFVHVTRDMTDTVASIMKGRARHGIPDDEWWGASPPHYANATFPSVLERVVCQVWDVRRYVEECLEAVDDHRQLVLPYETFCDDPSQVLEWIEASYRRHGVDLERRVPADSPVDIRRPATVPERSTLADDIAVIVDRLEASR